MDTPTALLPVSLTDRAARRITEIAASDPATPALRISVEGGGCSGFSYKFDLVGARAEASDFVIEQAGAKVLIDPVSLEYMAGSEIDFVDDLIGASFKIQNPNVRLRHQLFDVSHAGGHMKIVTWNINGVKARLEGVAAYLREASPDVLCMQEIKNVDEGFPVSLFEDAGYQIETHGQKGFNGVAIASKFPLEDVARRLPGNDDDEQSRYIEATISRPSGAIRIASLYLPNGNPLGTEKFSYKLGWMDRLRAHAQALLEDEMPVVLAGDFNVIPEPADAKRPAAWTGDALFQPESRAAYRRLINLGYIDAVRACEPGPGVFTFWDYQAGSWNKDDGIRIDHLLLSPQAADRLSSAGVDRFTRGWDKPSDHAPAWIEVDMGS